MAKAKKKSDKSKRKPVASEAKRASKSKRTARSGDWSQELVQAVWPQERDYMERPERYRYVRKLLPSQGCVFCAAASAPAASETLVLAKDDLVMVLMNKFPYNTGHLLVVPIEHQGDLTEIADDVSSRMAKWMKLAVKLLRQELNCQGFNLGLNHGAVAGAGIPDHLHWHVIPRWGGDTNFFPLIAETKVLPETLEQTYNRLKPVFEKAVLNGKTT